MFFFFFFFFTQVQTPATLFSGEVCELWSIVVVRLAHSADLRSRLHDVSSAPSVAYRTGCSRVVTHRGSNPARWCLTSVIWREPVCHNRLAVVVGIILENLTSTGRSPKYFSFLLSQPSILLDNLPHQSQQRSWKWDASPNVPLAWTAILRKMRKMLSTQIEDFRKLGLVRTVLNF